MDTETAEPSARFVDFVGRAETRLRRALVASYGPSVGRDATVDALSWAWEHWDQLRTMANPIGYLYRVGQTASRRYQPTQPIQLVSTDQTVSAEDFAPELVPALAQPSVQQRSVVVLVHGFGMTQRHVAEVLDISVSTVREHLVRGMTVLRRLLEDEMSVDLEAQLAAVSSYLDRSAAPVLLDELSPERCRDEDWSTLERGVPVALDLESETNSGLATGRRRTRVLAFAGVLATAAALAGLLAITTRDTSETPVQPLDTPAPTVSTPTAPTAAQVDTTPIATAPITQR